MLTVNLDLLLCSQRMRRINWKEMADRGFGLTRDDLMRIAFTIVDKSGRPNPFHDGMAGRGWMDGFKRRHPKISLRTPQSLELLWPT